VLPRCHSDIVVATADGTARHLRAPLPQSPNTM
jgi:hypothetical protein